MKSMIRIIIFPRKAESEKQGNPSQARWALFLSAVQALGAVVTWALMAIQGHSGAPALRASDQNLKSGVNTPRSRDSGGPTPIPSNPPKSATVRSPSRSRDIEAATVEIKILQARFQKTKTSIDVRAADLVGPLKPSITAALDQALFSLSAAEEALRRADVTAARTRIADIRECVSYLETL